MIQFDKGRSKNWGSRSMSEATEPLQDYRQFIQRILALPCVAQSPKFAAPRT